MNQDLLDIAWSAGFFDGEGCTYLHRSQRQGSRVTKLLKIEIAQTSVETLEKFHKATNRLGRINGPYKGKGINRKPYWHYAACGRKAVLIMETLWPALGQVKKDQFLLCKKEYDEYLKQPRLPSGVPKGSKMIMTKDGLRWEHTLKY